MVWKRHGQVPLIPEVHFVSLLRRSCPTPARVLASLKRGGSNPLLAKLPLALAALATLGFAGCAQQPQQVVASHGKEYFPSSKYGPISRRVVADGQPIPHGGGQYLVGKPYTVAGQTYYPSERHIVQIGNASWYGDAFHGRLTANGEIYDRSGFTAAHPTMPLPSYARVTNLRNNTSMIVRVNDRGPYASNRIMDVSGGVADALDIKRMGTAKVKVEYVARASLAGSNDTKLLATLRVNGPAQWPGEPTIAVAEAAPPARVAALAPRAADPRVEPSRPTMAEADDVRPVRAHRVSYEAERPADRTGRPVVDPHADLARLIETSRADVRPVAGDRPARVAASGRMAGASHAGRIGSEPPDRPRPVTARGVALPPPRPLEARLARGGRGWDDQRRFRQAGLHLANSRED